jgi:hypothetical protein
VLGLSIPSISYVYILHKPYADVLTVSKPRQAFLGILVKQPIPTCTGTPYVAYYCILSLEQDMPMTVQHSVGH